jgi:uncharacterized protein YggE
MKKLIILLSILPLFGYGQTNNNDKLVTVVGIAELEINPDLITLSMTVRETENIKKESDIVILENKFQNFLKSLGIDKDSFSIDRFYAREQSTMTGPTKFKQDKTYRLIIPKATLLDTIVTKCFELGMENVTVAKIDHSKIDSLRNVLLTQALSSARNKAEIIAKNTGITIGNVSMVNESYRLVGDRLSNYNDGFYNLEEIVVTGYGSGRYNAGRAGSTINLEKLHLSKTVIVKYEIK